MTEPRPPTYCIPAWSDSFEHNLSRKLKAPALCCHSNRAGRGMRRLARLENGAAIYGCFIALCNIQSARRPEHRLGGWLTDDGTELGEPWTAEDMEDFTGFDAEIFEQMLAVLSAPRIGWLSTTATQPADIAHLAGRHRPPNRATSPTLPGETAHRQTDRQTDRESVSVPSPSPISETETEGNGRADTDSDSEAETEADSDSEAETVSEAEPETAISPPPPIIFKNPRAVPCDYELQMRTIQTDIDARRLERHLAPVLGHMASSPIASALREPGVTLEHLLEVVDFEFAKYDAADDEKRREVITHLTPKNLFNPRYLSEAIDRAGRYADDPAGWRFDTGNGDAGLLAERAAFNARY